MNTHLSHRTKAAGVTLLRSTAERSRGEALFRVAIYATNSNRPIAERAKVLRTARRVLSAEAYRVLKALVWMLTEDQLRLRNQRN